MATVNNNIKQFIMKYKGVNSRELLCLIVDKHFAGKIRFISY